MALNLKAQATINLNTPGLRQFVKEFQGMQKGMQQLPRQWAAVQKTSNKALTQMITATKAIATNMRVATAQIRQMNAALVTAGNSAQRLARAGGGNWTMGGGGGGGRGGGGGGFWSNLWDRSRRYNSRLMLRAGRGGGSMLIRGGLPLGGLLGMGFLASAGGDERREYQGLGTTRGPMRAFHTNFGRIADTRSMLNSISDAQGDVTSDAYTSLRSLNIDPRGKDPTAIAVAALDAARANTRGQDPMQIGQFYHAKNLGALGLDLQSVRRAGSDTDEDYAKFKADFIRNSKDMSVEDKLMKKWQDLSVTFTESWGRIQSALFEGLAGLAPGFESASKALATFLSSFLKSDNFKLIMDTFGSGMKWLGDYLMSTDFKDGFRNFVDQTIFLGKEMIIWAERFGLIKAAESYGPPEHLAPNYEGSPAFKAAMAPFTAIKGIIDALGQGPGQGGLPTMASNAATGIAGWGQRVGSWISGASSSAARVFGGGTAPGQFAASNLTADEKAYMDTLTHVEGTNGRYGIAGKEFWDPRRNRMVKAIGRYQVMDYNVPAWTKELLNQEMSVEQFRNDPLAQDEVARKRFGGLLAKYRNLRDALSEYHSGLSYANALRVGSKDINMTTEAYVKKGEEFYRRHPGALISIINATNGSAAVSTSTTGLPLPPSLPSFIIPGVSVTPGAR